MAIDKSTLSATLSQESRICVSMSQDEIYGPYIRMIHVLGASVFAAKHKMAKEHPLLDTTVLDLSPDSPAPSPRPERPPPPPTISLPERPRPSTSVDASGGGQEGSCAVMQTMQTRRLFWDPLPLVGTPPTAGLLFATLSTSRAQGSALGQSGLDEVLHAQVSNVFSVAEHSRVITERERIGRAVGAIGGVLKKGSLTFIADRSRFNNIAIKLKQLRLSDEEVLRRVVAMEEAWLSADRVDALLACAPTAEDLESIAPYSGDPELLATCEHFFFTVRYSGKVFVLCSFYNS